MKAALTSFFAGIIFALGLGIGGMTQPAKVIGFLDFAGNWDPSLAFVMMGAILVHAIFYRVIRGRSSPLFSPAFTMPTRTDVDLPLLAGAGIFGMGWGLGGFCPGPALTSLVSGNFTPVVVVIAMIVGMIIHDVIGFLRLRRRLESTSLGHESRIDA